MSSTRLKQICVYIEPDDVKKMTRARGKKGLATDSAYFRQLMLQDIIRPA